MRKLHCIVCDGCRKIINDPYEDYEQIQGKKRILDYHIDCFKKLNDSMKKKALKGLKVADFRSFKKYRKDTSLFS